MNPEHLSRQHLIPKCFKKELRLSKRELNEHIIYIDPKIHSKEDRYVVAIKQEIIRARKEDGIFTDVEDILKMRNEGWFRA